MWKLVQTIETQAYNVVVALVILLVGLILALVFQKILKKALQELELDGIIKKTGYNFSIEKIIRRSLAGLIYFLILFLFLNQLGVASLVLYIITIIFFIIISLLFLFGIKDFIPNFLAGLSVYGQKNWEKGKTIQVNEIKGKIKKKGLLELEIETKDKETIYVPNSLLLKSKIYLKK